MTSQHDRRVNFLAGQVTILAGHCPLTSCYFEPLPFQNVKTLNVFGWNFVGHFIMSVRLHLFAPGWKALKMLCFLLLTTYLHLLQGCVMG